MKQTSIVAALLTFFSLLLVLSAAVFFLYRGRQELQQHVIQLQGDLEGQQETLSEFQTTATARDMALSTAEALVATRDEAWDQLQGTREAELATRSFQESGQTPLVRIVQPFEGQEVVADETLEVVVIAGHRNGMRSLRLEVGEQGRTFQDNGEDYRIINHRAFTLPEGQLAITATVTSATGVTFSDVVTILVSPADDAEDAELSLPPIPLAIRPQ